MGLLFGDTSCHQMGKMGSRWESQAVPQGVCQQEGVQLDAVTFVKCSGQLGAHPKCWTASVTSRGEAQVGADAGFRSAPWLSQAALILRPKHSNGQ